MKARLIKAVLVLAMGAALFFTGASVDWGKLLNDALNGEVSNTAEQVETIQ